MKIVIIMTGGIHACFWNEV